MNYKNVVSAAIVFASVGAFSTPSMASWDTCAVKRLGVSGTSSKLVKVTSCGISSNNNKWLNIGSQENAALATLLTALSLGKKVKMDAAFSSANTTAASGALISTIYLDQ